MGLMANGERGRAAATLWLGGTGKSGFGPLGLRISLVSRAAVVEFDSLRGLSFLHPH